ncbi:24270_t:CDS:1, partial [Racocetra persica]
SFNDDETEVLIARVSLFPKTINSELILPDTIIPRELSLKRQLYLFNEVAQHIQNPDK